MCKSNTIRSLSLVSILIVFSSLAIAAETGKEVGEASYNVENCESVNEDEEEKKDDSGVEQKDLDECESLVK